MVIVLLSMSDLLQLVASSAQGLTPRHRRRTKVGGTYFAGHLQPARGLKLETLRSSSNKRRSSALTSLGTMIFKRTYSSSLPPRRLFKPCPRNRSRCPLCAPAGTVTSTCPSIVGTSMRSEEHTSEL